MSDTDTLLRAYHMLRTHLGPATLEQALQHAIFAPLLHMQARRLWRSDLSASARRAPPSQRQHIPGRAPLPRLTHDPRRLAANDHD